MTVDSESPAPEAMAIAAQVIGRGGLVALPTDTLYALAVNPFNPSAVERVFQAKGRAAAQALVRAIDAVRAGATVPLPKEDVIVPVELVVRGSTGVPRG